MSISETAISEIPKSKKSLVIENLDPDDFLLRVTFPKIIEEHIDRYRLVAELLKERVHEQLAIIDTASGRGYGSAILSEDFPNAKIVAGLEIGMGYARKAQDKYVRGKEQTLGFVQADATSIPIQSESADIVTGFEITEHIEKELQKQYIQELYRILKPGGTAFVSIPHRYSFEVNKKGETVRSGLHTNPHHLYEPTRDEMKDVFLGAGFSIQQELGQITVSPEVAEAMRKINKVVPIWPIFAWHPGQDVSVKPIPEGKIALTHIFVLKKPVEILTP
jgi:ubiquinone/menaquinone biosynthesis C-methylase UbiE